MNGLVQVVGDVNARLAASLTSLGLPVPTFHLGEDRLDLEEDAPRIVWVPRRGPTDDKIKPAADHPSQWASPPATRAQDVDKTPADPRPLWRRRLTVEAHVWGIRPDVEGDHDIENDYAATEQLGYHLVAAVHDSMFGSYAITSEDWTTTQRSVQRRGAVLIIGVEFHLSWVRESATLATVTAMPVVVGSAH